MIKQNKINTHYFAIFMCLVMLIVGAVALMSSEGKTQKAYAEETSKYTLIGSVNCVGLLPYGAGFNYTEAYSTTSGIGQAFSVQLYGTSIHGTTTASNNKVFGFSYITIIANVNTSSSPHNSNYPFGHKSYSLKNNSTGSVVASGTLSGTGSKTLMGKSLSDGHYTLTYIAGGTRSGIGAGTITDTFTYSFYVDTSAPTYSLKAGGVSVASGSYTDSNITYTASDSNFNRIAYKKPGASYFSSTTSSSYSVSSTTANNGMWQFYAYDTQYNTTSTVTIYLDTISPTGSISTSATYTNKSFSYNATDNLYLYCRMKIPTLSYWTSYTSGNTVSTSATNGWYTFQAYDKVGNYSAESKIYLDTIKPTGTLYCGTTAVSSGATVKGSYIKFVGNDTGSGLGKVYVKEPGSSSYTIGTSGSQYAVEGKYYFYAVDQAGNVSSYYNITLDNSSPTLSISGASFDDVTGNVFTVSVNEGTIYYKRDNGSYSSKTVSCTINEDYEDGKYYFYAVDGVGNVSATCYVVLLREAPVGKLIYSDEDNSVKFEWDNQYYSATINGKSYANGTWVRTEGVYTIFLSNGTGKFTPYHFTISCNYIFVDTIEATCSGEGYDLYRCTSCGAEEKRNIVEALPHDYVQTGIPETCTESGKIIYTCQVCGHEYEVETNPATGHSYITYVVTYATCTESGVRHYQCETCGDEYDAEIPASGHHYVTTEEKLDDGSTLRTYTCTECGHTYTENIGNQYDNVTTFVEDIINAYTPYMWWALIATSGIWSIVMGVFIIIAQKNEEKEKAKKMLINYAVGLVVIAIIVVACPLLVKGIASLIA